MGDWRSRENHKREAERQADEVAKARAAAPQTWGLYEELLTVNPPSGREKEYDTVLFSLTHAAWGGYKISEADTARVRALIESFKPKEA